MPATKTAQRTMKMTEIRDKARGLGITPGKMKKADIIHAVQAAEGNTPCFGHSLGYCDRDECCFLSDCVKTGL